ncbi:MAG: hypothetical protein KJ737_17740 [Proteobacteria bacterium]|nr:hypothetical protein [Pseudomonadota bacterium]
MIETLLEIWQQYGANGICTATINFIIFQMILFIAAFILCLLPLLGRWGQLVMANIYLYKVKRVKADSETIRDKVQSRLFHKAAWARRLFLEYAGTWQDLRTDNEEKASMPVKLKEFLTPDTVIEAVGFQRVADALPGIFVAMGIFGTFYGLVLGLKGLDIEHIEQLQHGIGQLINGLSFAFLTSLAGIFLSVVFSLIHRFEINRIEKNVLVLDAQIEPLFPCHTSEWFANSYRTSQDKISRQLTHLPEEIASRMSYKLGVAFGESVKTNIVPIFHDINQMLKENGAELKQHQERMFNGFDSNLEKTEKIITDHFRSTQEKQSEVIEKILAKYVDNLNLTFRDQLNGLRDVISETTNLQVDTREKIAEFNEKLQKQFESQSELIEKTSKAGEILGATIESFETIATQFKNSTTFITKAAGMMESSAEKAMKGHEILSAAIETQMNAIRSTREELEKSWTGITKNIEKSVSGIRTSVQEMGGGFSDVFTKVLAEFETKVNDVINRFTGILGQFTGHIADMPLLLTKIETVLNMIVDAMVNQKDMLVDLKEKASQMLVSDIREALDISEKLSIISERINSSSVKHKDWFDNMLSRMNQSEESFEVRNRNVVDEFSKLTDNIVSKIQNSMGMFEKDGPVITSIHEFSENISGLSEKIKGRDMDIVEPIISLDGNISNLKKILEEIEKNGNGMGNENILNKIAAIDHQLNYISTDLSESVLKILNQIFHSSDKMVKYVDEIQKLGKTSTLSGKETRKGLLKRMMNR